MRVDNPERIPEPGSTPLENFYQWHIADNVAEHWEYISLVLIVTAFAVRHVVVRKSKQQPQRDV